jgi:hypothetical protein
MEKSISWVIEHYKGDNVDTRYVRETEAEASQLLNEMQENDMFPETGAWRKVPVYAD